MATFDDVVTNEQIQAIAEGIRQVTRTTEPMTVPEMPGRLLQIKVVETKDVSVSFSTASPLALGTFSTAVQHLFIVTPKTSADAKLLQKVKPEIELAYDTETGVLSLAYSISRDVEIDFLVADLLLSGTDSSKGFLIVAGGSSALDLYDPTSDYDKGQMFLHNIGTDEAPAYTLAVTTSTHGAEAYDPAHNAVMAKDIDIERLSNAISRVTSDLAAHKDDRDNPHGVTASQVGLGSVDNTRDTDKPISRAAQAALDKKVDKVEGKQLSTNDFTNSDKSNVENNTAARHSHENKAVLDATEQPYKTAEKQKLEGIASGAQVNVIEKISVNGEEQTIEGKGVNIEVPTKVSELENDRNYATQTEADGYAATRVSGHNTNSAAHVDIRNEVAAVKSLAQEAKSIAESRASAISKDTLAVAVSDIQAMPATELHAGDTVWILQDGVPDLWIYSVENSYVNYTYTTDEAFVSQLGTNGYVQVGYYRLAKSETEKVDLSGYVEKTRKINGKDLQNDVTLNAGDVGADEAGTAAQAVAVHNNEDTAHSELFGRKVDKVNGKGLSTNDFTNDYKGQVDSNTQARHTHSNKGVLDNTTASFTTEEKNKLLSVVLYTAQSLTDAQKQIARDNIGAGTSSFDGQYGSLTGQPYIPTKESDLTADRGYATSTEVNNLVARYLLLTGGTLTGALTFNNNVGINSYAGNTILYNNGTTTYLGHGSHATSIRGNAISFATRPTYNSTQLALKSEIPSDYVTLGTSQTITGAKTFNANVNIGTSSSKKNLYVYGDIYQEGSSYTTHAEHLYTASNFVYTRDGATAGMGSSSYTGIIAKLYDGSNDGGILYDNKGIGRIGDIAYDSSGNPLVTGMQPIATREESPNAYGLFYWDSTNLRLVSIAPAAAGKVMTSNGTGSAPSWKAPLKKRGVFTLTTSGWSSKKQTVTVSGLSTADLNTVVPELGTNGANSINWANYGINAIAEASGSITFSCSIVPSVNLTFYVVSEVME